MPETFDLDAAFAELAGDIAHSTHSPGAASAVRGARRRRRTTIGTAVAGLALIAGAVAVGQAVTRHDAVPPADLLPAPAPLDGPGLTAATEGWTPAWTSRSKAAHDKFAQTFGGACFASIPRGDGAFTWLGNGHDDVALAFMNAYGIHAARAQHGWQRLEQEVAGCRQAVQISSFRDDSGVEGRTYRITQIGSETAPSYLWIVRTPHEVGELKIFDQRDPLPAATDPLVARALLAAAQDPASYLVTTTPTPTSSTPVP